MIRLNTYKMRLNICKLTECKSENQKISCFIDKSAKIILDKILLILKLIT